MHRVFDSGICSSREAGAEGARTDRVSDMSRAIRSSAGFRAALVERIRMEIKSGSYETTWRLNAAADRMVDRLSPGA